MKKLEIILSFFIVIPVFLYSCKKQSNPITETKTSIESFYVSNERINKFDSISVTVILPPNYKNSKKNYPSLYFLPGYNQTDSVIYDLRIDSLLNKSYNNGSLKEFIFITYDNQNNNYVNWVGEGQKWSDFIDTSLIEIIDSRYRTINKSSKRGLYGVSMGGEGALYNGLMNPEKFGVIMSHSASIHYSEMYKVFDWTKPFLESYFSPIYGTPLTQEKWQLNNLLWLVENHEISQEQEIYFDVGVDDHLEFYKTNILLDSKLNRKLIPHTFKLSTGGHGNEYYITNMPSALEFWDNAIKAE